MATEYKFIGRSPTGDLEFVASEVVIRLGVKSFDEGKSEVILLGVKSFDEGKMEIDPPPKKRIEEIAQLIAAFFNDDNNSEGLIIAFTYHDIHMEVTAATADPLKIFDEYWRKKNPYPFLDQDCSCAHSRK